MVVVLQIPLVPPMALEVILASAMSDMRVMGWHAPPLTTVQLAMAGVTQPVLNALTQAPAITLAGASRVTLETVCTAQRLIVVP